ncbi:protein of unknown function [Hyphomicrobium sp. MC1]|nr:protein of unknown function [Hyphomicrobium sp. MC1]
MLASVYFLYAIILKRMLTDVEANGSVQTVRWPNNDVVSCRNFKPALRLSRHYAGRRTPIFTT